MAREVVLELNANKAFLRQAVYRRGLGEEFVSRYKDTPEFKAAEPRVVAYDIMALARRPLLVEHSGAPPKTRARAASYARWWYAHARLGKRMLPTTPPPGPAGPCGRDGSENTCRLCGKGKTKGNTSGDLLCCSVGWADGDGCPSAWHTTCLGLSGVPSGDWACPCCAYAPRNPCMPRWPAVVRAKKSAPSAPAHNFLAESADDSDKSEDE